MIDSSVLEIGRGSALRGISAIGQMGRFGTSRLTGLPHREIRPSAPYHSDLSSEARLARGGTGGLEFVSPRREGITNCSGGGGARWRGARGGSRGAGPT